MISFIINIVSIAVLATAIQRGWLFVDFQVQVGSFIFGRRFGTKRRGPVTPVFDSQAAASEDL